MKRRGLSFAGAFWLSYAAVLVLVGVAVAAVLLWPVPARAEIVAPAVADTCTLPVPVVNGRIGEHRPLRVVVRAMVREAPATYPAAWVAYTDSLGAEQWLRVLLSDLVMCERGGS